jgi:hypothetical protein
MESTDLNYTKGSQDKGKSKASHNGMEIITSASSNAGKIERSNSRMQSAPSSDYTKGVGVARIPASATTRLFTKDPHMKTEVLDKSQYSRGKERAIETDKQQDSKCTRATTLSSDVSVCVEEMRYEKMLTVSRFLRFFGQSQMGLVALKSRKGCQLHWVKMRITKCDAFLLSTPEKVTASACQYSKT